MEYDCCMQKGTRRFRFRTGGILVHDGKMLFVKNGFVEDCHTLEFYYYRN